MRTATTVEFGTNWHETAQFAIGAEALGLDVCWVAEAWGADAPSALGYLAARTSRMLLGSGVIQVGTRTPVSIAMTALTLQHLSDGRFVLGLGSSGPQVLEGLHGVPFDKPLMRMRETIEIVRAASRGEKIDFHGTLHDVPRGDARPMRLATEAAAIPVYVASLSPRMLRLTGEVADGWLGTSFVPEGASAFLDPLRAGLAQAGRALADLDVCQGAEVAFAADDDEQARMVGARKKELAFSLGGMGSATTNFYNDAYSRQGWAEAAAQIRRLWQDGRRDDAAALVTDEMVLQTTLIGTEARIHDRLRVWRDAGVTTVRLYPAGETLTQRLDTLGRAIGLVRTL
jgi:F420-dependent oxidoreductase-like protein